MRHRLNTNATPLAASILPRVVSFQDMFERDDCEAFAIAGVGIKTDVNGGVYEMLNLADPTRPFEQPTESFRPAVATDADLGMSALTFGSDRQDFLTLSGGMDYTQPFTLMVGFKTAVGTEYMNIFGDESITTVERVNILHHSSGKIRGRINNDFAESVNAATTDEWYVGILTGDGTGAGSFRLVGQEPVDINATASAVAGSLYIGDDSSGFGFHGSIYTCAAFSSDFSATQSDMDDLILMARGALGPFLTES